MSDTSTSQSSLVVRECLLKARAGDTAARDRLFAACRSYLGLIARANVQPWLRTKVDASDLVQQTMLDAHRDFHRFRGESDQEWLAWLRQILNHNACDAARHYGTADKRAVRHEVSLAGNSTDSTPGWDLPSPDQSPSQLAIHNESELRLAEAIDQLPEDYREVIILRNLQRLPFDAVAEQMGRTRPAAQMLWARALEKLKSLLDNRVE
ncbi:MAG: sigma-70 family RNA polymerase sigma factor [Planctomycetaceae bacterium]